MKYVTFYTEILARNTYLDPLVEDYLKHLQLRSRSDKVKKYIKSNIRRYLINDFTSPYVNKIKKVPSNSPQWLKDSLAKGEEVYHVKLTSQDINKIGHWIDYLNTLDNNRDLSRISIPQLIQHVKEWDESFKKIKLNEEDGVEEVHSYSDGFKWIKVFGKNSLNREGKLMNHCAGSYYDVVSKGNTKIYSLRDKSNRPHVTVEVTSNKIEQIKGKNNEPALKYIKYIVDFLKKNYIKYDRINRFELKQYNLIYTNENVYDLNNLLEKINLPNLHLELYGYDIEELPENLTIGTLDIYDSKLKKLPKGLTCKVLSIMDSEITELPDNLTVTELIQLDNRKMTKLGDNITINDNLYLDKSKITKLPKNLKVAKTLDLEYTKIQEIPSDIQIGESLYLTESSVSKLPDNLKIPKNLFLNFSKITKLPKNLQVGTLDISNTDISEIPDDIKVNNNLYIKQTKVTKLPDNLTIKGVLSLSGDNITGLPENLQVGTLDIKNTKIKVLPKSLKADKIIYNDYLGD